MGTQQSSIYCGHNVIQLYFPIHMKKGVKGTSLSKLMSDLCNHNHLSQSGVWKQVQTSIKERTEIYNELRNIFPAAYFMKIADDGEISFCDEQDLMDESDIIKMGFRGFSEERHWIDEQYVQQYYHPSVRTTLFGKRKSTEQTESINKNFEVQRFRLQKDNSQEQVSAIGYPGDLYLAHLHQNQGNEDQDSYYLFEWLSYELFVFSPDFAIAMARLSVLENHRFLAAAEEGELVFHFERNVKSDIQKNILLPQWMKFSDLIRQIYLKYDMQDHLNVMKVRSYTQTGDHVRVSIENDVYESFYEIVKQNGHLPELFVLSEVAEPEKDAPKTNAEPNAFSHAFVEWDGPVHSLTQLQIFSLLSVDGDWGMSGSDLNFIHQFTDKHTLNRWSPYTIYSAIDYAAVTIVRASPQYRTGKQNESRFADLMYQHHTRQYVWFILLQLYYRSVLQDLARQYAMIDVNAIQRKNSKDSEAKRILREYYDLNQHLFFERVTNEIQGLEMWKLYQESMGIKTLFQAVREDVRELNQRLIESNSEKQEQAIWALTIMVLFAGASAVLIAITAIRSSDMTHFYFNSWLLLIIKFILNLRGIMLILGVLLLVLVPIYAGYLLIRNRKSISFFRRE